MNVKIKTPKYWQMERFQPLTEVETAYGHKVMIPSRFINGWQTAKMVRDDMVRRGLDPLDGLEIHAETDSIYYDLERVFYEIYEEED